MYDSWARELRLYDSSEQPIEPVSDRYHSEGSVPLEGLRSMLKTREIVHIQFTTHGLLAIT